MTPLYGGALSAEVPAGFLDVSRFRDVPDSQEVFVDKDNEDSMIFELLEYIDAGSDKDAVIEHLKELSELNDTKMKIESFESVEVSVEGAAGFIVTTFQPIAKWGQSDKENSVAIFVGVIRIKKVETDMIVSVNLPGVHSVDDVRYEKGLQGLKSVMKSIVVNDWNLFV